MYILSQVYSVLIPRLDLVAMATSEKHGVKKDGKLKKSLDKNKSLATQSSHKPEKGKNMDKQKKDKKAHKENEKQPMARKPEKEKANTKVGKEKKEKLQKEKEKLQKEKEEKSQKKKEERLRKEKEEKLQKEKEEKLQKEKLRKEKEKLQKEKEEKLQKEKEEKLQKEKEEQLQKEKEEKLQKEKEEKLQKENEEKLQKEKEEKLQKEKQKQLGDEKLQKVNQEDRFDAASATTTAAPVSPKALSFDVGSPTSSASSAFSGCSFSFENLSQWNVEAEKAGMSLFEYMEDMSRQHLEQMADMHMKEVAGEVDASKGEKRSLADEDAKDAKKLKPDEKEEVEEQPAMEDGSDAETASTSEEPTSEADGSAGESQDEEELSGEDECMEEAEEESEDAEALVDGLMEEEPTEKPKAKELAESETKLAIIAATDHTATPKDFSNANSVTHKAEWDKFNRQALDRKKFPIGLAGHFVSNKLDLFQSWLTCQQSWQDLEIHLERKAEKRVTATKQREGKKAREIYKLYSKTKADDLMRRLRERGLYHFDPDFPKDEEDRAA